MAEALTLRAIAHFYKTEALIPTDKPVKYEVQGLPPGTKVLIAEMNHSWRILRTDIDRQGEWQGAYKTAEDALAALEDEFSN